MERYVATFSHSQEDEGEDESTRLEEEFTSESQAAMFLLDKAVPELLKRRPATTSAKGASMRATVRFDASYCEAISGNPIHLIRSISKYLKANGWSTMLKIDRI